MGGSKYKIHIHCVWVNLGRFLFNRQNPVSPALPLLPFAGWRFSQVCRRNFRRSIVNGKRPLFGTLDLVNLFLFPVMCPKQNDLRMFFNFVLGECVYHLYPIGEKIYNINFKFYTRFLIKLHDPRSRKQQIWY